LSAFFLYGSDENDFRMKVDAPQHLVAGQQVKAFNLGIECSTKKGGTGAAFCHLFT